MEGLLRVGRSVEAKRSIVERIVEALAQAAAMPKSHVWAHLVDMPASQIVEFGHVVPDPSGEAAWIAALPEAERKEIEGIGRVRRQLNSECWRRSRAEANEASFKVAKGTSAPFEDGA